MNWLTTIPVPYMLPAAWVDLFLDYPLDSLQNQKSL